MSDEKLGGLSLDDIMAAAMSGLDDDSIDKHEKTDSPNENTKEQMGIPFGAPAGIVMKTCSVCGEETAVSVTQDICPKCNHCFDGSDVDSFIPKKTDIVDEFRPIEPKKESVDNSGVSLDVIDDPKSWSVSAVDGSSTQKSTSQTSLTGEARDAYYRVFDLIDAGRTVEALQLSQALVNENMSNDSAWYVNGLAHQAEKNDAEAIKSFQQALAINATNAIVNQEIASCYFDNEDYELAQKHAQIALDNDNSLGHAKAIICDVVKAKDGLDAAIERLQGYIEKTSDNVELKNYLGTYYVEKAYEYVFDIPDKPFFDPMTTALNKQKGINEETFDTFPGFISKYDIEDAKKYANLAMSYFTLDNEFIKEYRELCQSLLEQCEIDSALLPLSNEKFIKVYQIFLGVFHFIIAFCTWGIGLPLLYGAYISKKANLVPGYIMNYMILFDSQSPLDFKERDLREKLDKHPFVKDMLLDHRKTKNENAVISALESLSNDGIFKYLGKELFRTHMYLLKCRLAYYKRMIEIKKAQKQERDSSLNATNK